MPKPPTANELRRMLASKDTPAQVKQQILKQLRKMGEIAPVQKKKKKGK